MPRIAELNTVSVASLKAAPATATRRSGTHLNHWRSTVSTRPVRSCRRREGTRSADVSAVDT